MALYGGARDISLFQKVNRELMGNIITQQCVYYKLRLNETKVNMYGEAAGARYYKEPVIFTEVGRYLIYATQDKYSDLENKEVKKINTDIWIPYKPASLYEPLTPNRRKIYLSRWIKRNNSSIGWYLSPVNEHWHDSVEKSLFEVFEEENYIIKKERKTNIYKALLFKKL